ncbi:MAG TPA: recombinase family protein [Tepidisphaeraceae bacterium]|nr:recombinase family protein [Tepidisphaeraceae bacterium]
MNTTATTTRKLNTARPLVISYLRFSMPTQAKGDSTRRQTDLAEQWCEKTGHKLTDRLDDKGISAYRGRNANEGALATFLELVKAGTVPPGSILLVEELDRISRQEPEESLHLFLSIIRSGITVVTLNTGDEFRKGEIDTGKLMIAVVKFATAHDESKKKSFRLGQAWKEKRRKMKDENKPLTRRLPMWLKIVDGKIIVDAEKAAQVIQIFKWAADGLGTGIVVRKANHELSAIGRKPYYTRSYIAKILHNRAAIGEFQPHVLTYTTGKKTRTPEGEPIKGYYPAIIDEGTFNAVQTRLRRNRGTGGPNVGFVNLFRGIFFNGNDGTTMQIANKGSGTKKYVSTAAIEKRPGAAEYVGIPVTFFEIAFVWLLEGRIDFTDASDRTADLSRHLDAIEHEMAGVAERRNEIKAALVTTGTNAVSLVEVMNELDAKHAALKSRRDELRGELATTEDRPADTARQIVRMAKSIANHALTEDDRLNLRSLIARMVARIDGRTIRHKRMCGLVANIAFTSGQTVEMKMAWSEKISTLFKMTLSGEEAILMAPSTKMPSKIDEAEFWSAKKWVQEIESRGGIIEQGRERGDRRNQKQDKAATGPLPAAQSLATELGCHWSNVYRKYQDAKARLRQIANEQK